MGGSRVIQSHIMIMVINPCMVVACDLRRQDTILMILLHDVSTLTILTLYSFLIV